MTVNFWFVEVYLEPPERLVKILSSWCIGLQEGTGELQFHRDGYCARKWGCLCVSWDTRVLFCYFIVFHVPSVISMCGMGVTSLSSRDRRYSICFGGRCPGCQWLWFVNRPVTASQLIFHGSAEPQLPKEWLCHIERFAVLVNGYLWVFKSCSFPAWTTAVFKYTAIHIFL